MKTNKHLVAFPFLSAALPLTHFWGNPPHTARSRLPSLTADADDGRDSCTMEKRPENEPAAADALTAHTPSQKVGNKK